MKICTKLRVTRSHQEHDTLVADETEIIDISLVDDDHEFGYCEDGFLHLPGKIL